MDQLPSDRRTLSVDWLLCFAVTEEASHYHRSFRSNPEILVTGMGRRNASSAIADALARWHPKRVVTAGFAGGLNPALKRGTVVFDTDQELGLETKLIAAGAVPAKFHCAARIAVTAADKELLYRQTGADVVEMESSVIRNLCRAADVPSATIRVISDAADEDLPLDFNSLMTPADRINWWKFARTVMLRPTLLRRLIAFQGNTRLAAKELARVLEQVIHKPTCCS